VTETHSDAQANNLFFRSSRNCQGSILYGSWGSENQEVWCSIQRKIPGPVLL